MKARRAQQCWIAVQSPLVRWILGGLGAIAFALWQAGVGQTDLLNPGGWGQLQEFLAASVRPDLSPALLQTTLAATVTTLAYAVCGTTLSLGLGLLGGIVGAAVWWETVWLHWPQRGLWVQRLVRGGCAIPRAIHEVIWGLLLLRILGLDALVAVLAIAIPYGAIVAKVFAEQLDATPRQPLQVLRHSGAGAASAFLYGLFPLASLNLVSYSFYRFECSIRSAAVLGIIGAGGLGYEILLSLQSLRYEQLWTFFYALMVLNGAVDWGSAWLRRRLGCVDRLALNQRRGPTAGRSRSRGNGFLLLLVLGLIGFSFWYLQPDYSRLWQLATWQRLGQLGQAAWPPDWSVIPQLPALSLTTLAMSVLAIAIAAIGGTILAFPAAHNLWLPGGLLNPQPQARGGQVWAWGSLLLTRLGLLLARSIPAPVWALVVLYVLFPGVLPGAVALGLHNLGILGRLQAEVIENLEQRPLAALSAQGTPNSLVFLYGVLPLTVPRFLAYILYRWEVCMRETVIVGLVGAGGLGRLLTEQISGFDYAGVVVSLTGFVLLTWLVDSLSQWLRRSLQ